jgi:predicted transcriptional regulator
MVINSTGMPTKKPQVTVYVRDEVNAALDAAALKERRSRSQMAAVLIEEALQARGYPVEQPDSNPEK